MKIKWFGQSCFLITAENGTKILTDPFKDMMGYKLPEMEADIVSISHNHRDHNYVNAAKGNFELINKPGGFSKNGIAIQGVETFHDKVSGARKGKNLVFKFEMDQINLCHLGDLGHILNSAQIEAIGKVDILFLPVGGGFTIDARDAVQVMRQLNPAIVIPMHYRTKALGLLGCLFGKVDRFISASGLKAGECKVLEINRGNISGYQGAQEIVVLRYD
jgi:L-ascorbate metabolism protein UlaG (beta-lactamase superfamily)